MSWETATARRGWHPRGTAATLGLRASSFLLCPGRAPPVGALRGAPAGMDLVTDSTRGSPGPEEEEQESRAGRLAAGRAGAPRARDVGSRGGGGGLGGARPHRGRRL